MESRQLPLTLTQRELELFNDFWRALPEPDRQILEDLFESARLNFSPINDDGYPIPYMIYLLTLLIDEHKQVRRLKQQLQSLRQAPVG